VKIGFFGKLPGYGDFIGRNVSPALIKTFDRWLIKSLTTSQAQLKQHWQQQYFASPIWRFVISADLLCEHIITGIMMPSVDRSGRCYPLVVVAESNLAVNPFIFARQTDVMHQAAEVFILTLLEQPKPDLDQINQILLPIYLSAKEAMALSLESAQRSSPLELVSLINCGGFDLPHCHDSLLDCVLREQRVKITLWWTAGGVGVMPRHRYFCGMPEADSFSSFLIEPQTNE